MGGGSVGEADSMQAVEDDDRVAHPSQCFVQQLCAPDLLDHDRELAARVHGSADRQALETLAGRFHDARFGELLFRYRVRNLPDTVNDADRRRWQDWRCARLLHGAGGAFTLAQFEASLQALTETAGTDRQVAAVLAQLADYRDRVAQTLSGERA